MKKQNQRKSNINIGDRKPAQIFEPLTKDQQMTYTTIIENKLGQLNKRQRKFLVDDSELYPIREFYGKLDPIEDIGLHADINLTPDGMIQSTIYIQRVYNMNLYDPNEKEKFYTDISKLNEHD